METSLPLRATIDGNDIHAFEFTNEKWDSFKASYKKLNPLMPCCGILAIPKTSKLGNFFFAHKKTGVCHTEPESAEHIFLKSVIAKVAIEAGWAVTTEFRGISISGDEWVADILCRKGKAVVALEVQLSAITYKDLTARTERYKLSNVRAAWFVDELKFKDWKSKSHKNLPIFGISRFKAGESPIVQHFDQPIEIFVKLLLDKKIQWVEELWEYGILYIEDICWKCNKPIKQVYGSFIDVYGESAKTVPNASTILSELSEFITNEELKSLGLNIIGKHEKLKGNAPGFPYCNVCIHCGAPQNNYSLMSHLQKQDRISEHMIFTSPRESSGHWKLLT